MPCGVGLLLLGYCLLLPMVLRSAPPLAVALLLLLALTYFLITTKLSWLLWCCWDFQFCSWAVLGALAGFASVMRWWMSENGGVVRGGMN